MAITRGRVHTFEGFLRFGPRPARASTTTIYSETHEVVDLNSVASTLQRGEGHHSCDEDVRRYYDERREREYDDRYLGTGLHAHRTGRDGITRAASPGRPEGC